MKKYSVEIKEMVRMVHNVTIETDKSEDEIESILDELESIGTYTCNGLSSMCAFLENEGINIVEYCEDEGEMDEVEVTDWRDIDEE